MIEKYKKDHKRVTEKQNTEHTLRKGWRRSEKNIKQPVIPRKAYKYYYQLCPKDDN